MNTSDTNIWGERKREIGIVEVSQMKEKTCQTRCGTIHYWASVSNPDTITLVFLPGLTADHRLFDKQIQYFKNRYNVIVWDAPAHASSWPFRFDFDLFDKAKWLNDILNQEGITRPVIIGQVYGWICGTGLCTALPRQNDRVHLY